MTTTDSHVDENDVVELLQGTLASSRRDRIETHLDRCPECRELIAIASRSEAVEKKKDPTGETLIPWNEAADLGATVRTQIVPTDEGLFKPDTLVDNFQIIRFLDRGGMGELYLARDIGLGRRVALKVIRRSHLESKRSRERFLFEARATARFNHPNIVAIHSVGEFRGLPYVALEYLEGESLRERMKRERLGTREAIRIARAIASALEEAHEHGIIHRDLKPENVLIPRDGRPRVVDFGLATAFEDESLERHRAGSNPTVIDPGSMHHKGGGTPLYMAPEQWTKQDTDGATDIWALGVIMYEMVMGRRPYQEFEQSRAELARKVLLPEPAPRITGEGLRELAGLVAHCLEKQPALRPTASTVIRALDAITDRKPSRVATNPFRGLLPFSERHADLFFGRDAEVAAAVERLREETVLAIVGPSGAGKSSFVQAGIIPRLREQGSWTVVKLRPGSQPFYALAGRIISGEETGEFPEESLAGGDADPTRPPPGRSDQLIRTFRDETFNLSRELFESPHSLALHLHRLARERGGRVLLFIDQLEELSTLVKSDAVRSAFMRAIIAASEDREGPIRVVLTVRDDFLGRLAIDQDGRDALSRVMVVKTPGPDALRQALEQPVQALGYRFDPPELAERMVKEVEGEPAALPLLSFAANLLWERRNDELRTLTTEAYSAMGGVAGALADHADGVLFGMSPDRIAVAKQLLLRMVTADRTRKVITREEALAGLGREGEDVLGRLVRSRLVTVRRAMMETDDQTQLELVHESLIRTWRRLERWLDESREERVFLEQIGQAAVLWEKRGRRAAELWEKEALFEALAHLSRLSTPPNESITEFLAAGQRREARKRRRLLALGAAASAALAAIMLVLVLGKRAAQEESREARTRWTEALLDGARTASMRSDAIEASARIRAALEAEDSALARVLWWDLKRRPMLFARDLGAPIAGVAFSPDGTTIAAACDGTAALVDRDTGATSHVRGFDDRLTAIAYAKDGAQLAAGMEDGRLVVRDLSGRKMRQVRAHDGSVLDVAYSPDGKSIATAGSDRRIVVFDAATLEEKKSYSHASPVAAIAWSPDGNTIAAATREHSVVLWSIEKNARSTLDGHRGPLLDVAFSPDGKRLASASEDRTVRVWDLATRRAQEWSGHAEAPRALTFSSDGALLASGGLDRTILIFHAEQKDPIAVLEGHEDGITGLAFAPDGDRLASVSSNGELRLWSASRLSAIDRPQGHAGAVLAVAFAPDGSRFVTGSSDHTARIWNLSGETERTLSHGAPIAAIAWSPDGKTIASGGHDQTIRLFDAKQGRSLRALRGHQGHVLSLAFSPDGQMLASAGSDATVRLWKIESGSQIAVLRGHEGAVWNAVFSRDGTLLASSGRDGTIRVWEVKKQRLSTLLGERGEPIRGLAFDGDERLISSVESGVVRTWDIASGASTVKARLEGRVLEVAITQDGTIAAATANGVAHLIRGSRSILLRGHEGEISEVRFSPDGKLAVTAGADHTVRLWDAATGKAMWREPLLSSDGRALPDGPTKWRALAIEARFTGASGDLACIAFDDRTEGWSIANDERILSLPGRASDVRSTGHACLASIDGNAKLATREQTIDLGPATAIEVDRDRIWIGRDGAIVEHDLSGAKLAELQADAGISAIARSGERFVAGYRDGSLELIPRRGEARPAFSFESTPSSAVARILSGPLGTIAAGHRDGSIGLWSIENGHLLAKGRLHGSIRHLALTSERLFAATDLGSSLSWEFVAFSRERCDLLTEIWSEVPVVWEGGLPVRRATPADHPCRR